MLFRSGVGTTACALVELIILRCCRIQICIRFCEFFLPCVWTGKLANKLLHSHLSPARHSARLDSASLLLKSACTLAKISSNTLMASLNSRRSTTFDLTKNRPLETLVLLVPTPRSRVRQAQRAARENDRDGFLQQGRPCQNKAISHVLEVC